MAKRNILIENERTVTKENLLFEQGGQGRAAFGKDIINKLSERLTKEYGKGFSPANIRYMRQFYQCFPFCHALSDKLTWTHWRTLLKVQDETVRNFYLTECISGNWSVRQLERQINTLFYERMLASKDQKTVREEIQRSVPQALEPKEIIRDPYILEFIEFLSSPLPQPRIVGMMFFLSLSNVVKE